MSVIQISALQLPMVLEAHAKKLPQAFQVACVLAAERGRAYLVRTSPVDLGQYKNSWKVKHGAHGPVIVNDAPHAGIIENGARPHPVSREGIEALTEWAKRKLLRGGGKKGKGGKKYGPKAPTMVGVKAPVKFGPKKAGIYTPNAHSSAVAKHLAAWTIDDEARSIAFAIAAKLKKEGQKGRFLVAASIPTLAKFLSIEMGRQVLKALQSKGF